VKLADALQRVTRLGLDSAPVIYFVEMNPRYQDLLSEVFRQIAAGQFLGITSVVTLGEVMVVPLREGRADVARRYRRLLLTSPGVRTLSIDPTTAERAADLRARYGFRLPDALQVAVAIEERCEAFLTNDRRLARITELRVLVLDDLEL
jgi:predicted nucleic acid-binding protein